MGRGPHGCLGPDHDKRRVNRVYKDVVKYLQEKHGLMQPSEFMTEEAQKEPFVALKKAIDVIVFNQECTDW